MPEWPCENFKLSVTIKWGLMSARIIDGKGMAQAMRQRIAEEVTERADRGLRRPGLAVILVGDNEASAIYVRNKRVACERAGIESQVIRLSADITQAQLLERIDALNAQEDVDGILVQLPLPGHINEETLIERIRPDKDVDGFHPYNVGRLVQRLPKLRACTPYGIMHMLQEIGQPVLGQHAVVVGASNIVGRPLAMELLLAGATVTVCHRFTTNLAEHVRMADILAVAVGKRGLIQGDWIKPGATVIDVGMNRCEDGSLKGDVNFEAARERAGWITPVPGGVGPMTVTMLLYNTLQAAKSHTDPESGSRESR